MKTRLTMNYVEGNIEAMDDIHLISPDAHKHISGRDIYHYHAGHELVICCSPSVLAFCMGTIVQSSGYTALYYPAGERHIQLNHPHGIYRRFLVEFPVDFLEEDFAVLDPKTFFCCSLSPEDMEEIQPCMDLLRRTENTPDDPWKLNAQKHLLALLFNAFARRIRNSAEPPSFSAKIKDPLIYDICIYIHQHIQEKITLDSLAASHYISRSTLTRRFRENTGVSVNQYLQRLRVNAAIQYLSRGHSVRDTAELCGFCDASSFIRVFEKHTQNTPKLYQKNR